MIADNRVYTHEDSPPGVLSEMAIFQQLGRVFEDHSAAEVEFICAARSAIPGGTVDTTVRSEGQTTKGVNHRAISRYASEAVKNGIHASFSDLVEDATTSGRITVKVPTAASRSVKRTAHIKEPDLRKRPATPAKKLMDHSFVSTAV